MSKMAKIFWNEIVAMVLSCGIITVFYFYFKLSFNATYLFTVGLMGIVTCISIVVCSSAISFSVPYLIATIIALSIFHLERYMDEMPVLTIISLLVLVLTILVLSLIASYEGKKGIKNLNRIIVYSFLCESITLAFVMKCLLVSWEISLVVGIVGIVVMAIINFFPFSNFDDEKLFNFQGYNSPG